MESIVTKQWIAPTRNAIKTKVSSGNPVRKMHNTKREYKGKGHKDMSKTKCYNCGE